MKNKVFFILFILILSLRALAQNNPSSGSAEIFIQTKNVPVDTTVVFTASTNQPALWHPDTHLLTILYREQTLEIPGNFSGCGYGFDLSGDCSGCDTWPNLFPQLGKNLYEITVTNSGKNASITIDANGCYFVGGDIVLTYNWATDKFYSGGYCIGSGSYGTDPIDYYLSYNDKSCLEMYLTLSELNNHPYLTWNPYHTTFIDYKIEKYKNGIWQNLISVTDEFYEDVSEQKWVPGGSKKQIKYRVSAQVSTGNYSLTSNEPATYIFEYNQQNQIKVNHRSVNIKSGIQLFPAFPNPFNAQTQIKYYLPQSMQVHLIIYNMNGQKIMSFSDYKEKGEQQFTLNMQRFPSGFYFYELKTESFRKINRLLLLK